MNRAICIRCYIVRISDHDRFIVCVDQSIAGFNPCIVKIKDKSAPVIVILYPSVYKCIREITGVHSVRIYKFPLYCRPISCKLCLQKYRKSVGSFPLLLMANGVSYSLYVYSGEVHTLKLLFISPTYVSID